MKHHRKNISLSFKISSHKQEMQIATEEQMSYRLF